MLYIKSNIVPIIVHVTTTTFMVVRKSKNEIEDEDGCIDDDDLVLDNVSDVSSIDLDDEDEIPKISLKTLTGKQSIFTV